MHADMLPAYSVLSEPIRPQRDAEQVPNPVADIPEFAVLGTGRGLIRVPMERDVPFTDRVRALVDTPEFQRLGRISQLGLAARVYPGATHTRFEHALGVFQNALEYLAQLAREPRFAEIVDRHLAEVLMVAALLHDLGHWPFCHPIEDLGLPNLSPHEHFAREFLGPDGPLADVLNRQWGVQPDEVLNLVTGRGNTLGLRLLASILSGPIDIDKMDYLDRDSLHCGVPYGRNFDRSRLIRSLTINSTGDGLAIDVKGRTAAELMVFARYVMFSEVYWHHAVRSATSMFARGFYEIHERLDLRSLFVLTDPEMMRRLLEIARNGPAAPLFEGVFGSSRRLYKRVAEYSFYQQKELYVQLRERSYAQLVDCSAELARRLSMSLRRPVPPTAILIDAPPLDREVEFDIEVYYPKEDVYRRLNEVSPVVEALAQTQFDDYVKRVRVFVEPNLAEDLSGITNFNSLVDQTVDAVA